ncbi:MurR/RpiR family transcriptional regulator [Halobacillus salinarum]|uniref:MurR/RpiR family transcriptional regulator n=1 Tax=Halobacillus salinarum TaxID=2932257 RepID=A0ABY4EN71_9BACI|nr:MurR/RpiR family transcriptional regulator [Halobacillus salinarum]UOQ45062.1 MurR/RpiR family transcriptional regulator [Halobacillus salinarum]
MGKLVDAFSTSLPNLTHSEKHVLYYVEQHLEESKSMPLTKMAEVNNVSTTTIVRLCHKLGMDGFAEFKYFLRGLEGDVLPDDPNPIERYRNDINESLKLLHPKDLEAIAANVEKADRIVILSVGLTKMIGEYLSKRLMQVNRSSTYIYESHMIDLISNWIGENDLVIFISSSGETDTLLKAADKLDHLNISTVAVTNDPTSTLYTIARQAVSAPVKKASYEGYDVSARSSLVMLADLIFEYYLKYVTEKD